MEAIIEKIKLEKTQKGYAAFWERGGGFRNTGNACIVADREGQPKKAVYVRRRGHLANENHALIIVEPGDFIVFADHHREDFTITIYQIIDLKTDESDNIYAVTVKKRTFDLGEWDEDLPAHLEAAVEAAKEKALCYHCRCVHYAITE